MRQTANTPERISYGVGELAQAMGVTPPTIYKWGREGKLKMVTIGGRRLIPADQVARLLCLEVA